MSCAHSWIEPPECPYCAIEERDRLNLELVAAKEDCVKEAFEVEHLNRENAKLRAELEGCKAKLSECIYNCCEAKQKKIDHLRVVEAELRLFKEKHGV